MKRYCQLDERDKERLLECLYCPCHKECEISIEIPEDNENGTCKTRGAFINKLKGLGLND